MAIRPKAEPGLHNIECAGCGCDVKSNQIRIGKFTGLPLCLRHAEENHERHPVEVPLQQVPQPQAEPADTFKSFDVAFTPTALVF